MKVRKKQATKERRKVHTHRYTYLLFLSVVLLIIFLATFNYFLEASSHHSSDDYTSLTNIPTDEPEITRPPTPTPRPVPPLGQIPTTSPQTLNTWPKYTNQKYGYTLLYPPDWKIFQFNQGKIDIENASSIQIDSPGDYNGAGTYIPLGVTVIDASIDSTYVNSSINPNSPEIRALLNDKLGATIHIGNYTIVKTDDLAINGIPAHAVTLIIAWSAAREVILEHNGYVYEIGNNYGYEDEYKQLLSTFTFTR